MTIKTKRAEKKDLRNNVKTKIQKKLILFDFDGTLVNTLDLGLEYYNKYCRKLGAIPISKQEFRSLGGGDSRSMMKQKRLNLWKGLLLVILIRSKISSRVKELELEEGWLEVLEKISKNSYQLGILTTNSKARVEKYLNFFGVAKYFGFVESQVMVFRKHASIQKILKKNNLKQSEMVYIGDEERDFQACQKAGIDFIGVDWGYNNRRVLESAGASKVVSKPSDILSILAE